VHVQFIRMRGPPSEGVGVRGVMTDGGEFGGIPTLMHAHL
jgi:hypothetical protein